MDGCAQNRSRSAGIVYSEGSSTRKWHYSWISYEGQSGVYTRSSCVRVCQKLYKDYLMCKCAFHRWGAVYLMQHVYVCVYVWRKNVIQGAGCASVTWNSVYGSVSTDLQQRFSIFSTNYELLKLKNYLFFFYEMLEISYLINKNHITSLE